MTIRVKLSAGLGGWVVYDGSDFVGGAFATQEQAELFARTRQSFPRHLRHTHFVNLTDPRYQRVLPTPGYVGRHRADHCTCTVLDDHHQMGCQLVADAMASIREGASS